MHSAIKRIPVACEEISIAFHEGEVPAHVEQCLLRLYGSIYSTLAHFRAAGTLCGVSTYVVRINGEVRAAILFKISGRCVRVVNEMFSIAGEELRRFAGFVFARYPRAISIVCNGIASDLRLLRHPFRALPWFEDIALMLPHTVASYRRMLGARVRSHISRQLRRLAGDFSSFSFEAREGGGMHGWEVRKIMGLQAAGLDGKARLACVEGKKAQRLMRLLKDGGLVGMIRIEGCLCAAVINTSAEGNYFMEVTAQHPRFEEYCLGLICSYLTICACIERSGREFHFMRSGQNYETHLLGKRRDLERVTIYRYRLPCWLDIGAAWIGMRAWWRRRCERWIPQGEEGGRIMAALRKAIRARREAGAIPWSVL